eukprot:3874940-Pleurochrysis_carterae.AAC.3
MSLRPAQSAKLESTDKSPLAARLRAVDAVMAGAGTKLPAAGEAVAPVPCLVSKPLYGGTAGRVIFSNGLQTTSLTGEGTAIVRRARGVAAGLRIDSALRGKRGRDDTGGPRPWRGLR